MRPKLITVRIVQHYLMPCIIIEHDGVEVKTEPIDITDSAGFIMKGIEVALEALGYTPDLDNMYIDDSLMVLKFDNSIS